MRQGAAAEAPCRPVPFLSRGGLVTVPCTTSRPPCLASMRRSPSQPRRGRRRSIEAGALAYAAHRLRAPRPRATALLATSRRSPHRRRCVHGVAPCRRRAPQPRAIAGRHHSPHHCRGPPPLRAASCRATAAPRCQQASRPAAARGLGPCRHSSAPPPTCVRTSAGSLLPPRRWSSSFCFAS
ncbi:hypothetical protein PVAP13_8KG085452 [Panicum virgatum]|uniref:Uncharacterized protein n=1 Tax=Panicum virgatum TaxID=38727 RepID=A0A8T0PI44_PANVG|nr:hypothetical protein PVAP13_8KG085452 [Panicum virgatum]